MVSDKAKLLYNLIYDVVNTEYKNPQEALPEEAFITKVIDLRQALQPLVTVCDEEFEWILRELKASMVIRMDVGIYISSQESDHQSWLPAKRSEMDFYYWNRYKRYLEHTRHWNTRVTANLDKVSDEIIDLLGDPANNNPWKRRGLVLGDVQSGKTANYTALCNKAADVGYKVIIVMTGTTKNLRMQTQERLDTEFAGRKSKFLLDPKANNEIKNIPHGVGEIDARKRISSFTSVIHDFNSNILNSNDLTLQNVREPALFVVKKNRKILENLETWLIQNNADAHDMIDMPLLLIDDEADYASVNTNKPDEDPTATNTAIRSLLNRFYRSSFVGITATPYANIFISPDTTDEMIGDELFPRDFIYVLSAPTNYIGVDAIFGDNAEYSSNLKYLDENELDSFFPFNHKTNLAVDELPPSMYEAMGYFALINAVRDLRGDVSAHRSMLVNVSRLKDVQNQVKDRINEWLIQLRSDLISYSSLDESKAMQVKNICFLRSIWDRHGLENKAGCSWNDIRIKHLTKAVTPIEVRAVNQNTGATSLDYYAHPDGFRVIAVGGNSLSRGLTLEGLCVSYFYRNSQMYDTILQMGRWFGYRPNYEDLFKIWITEDADDWYGYICSATNELKDEIARMNMLKLTPKDFGLKVRQDPNSLIVTARNKMRLGTPVSRPITVSGRLLETPRLKSKKETLANNETAFRKFVKKLDAVAERIETNKNRHLWAGAPKEMVAGLLRRFDTHQWHLSFQGRALADYIMEFDGLDEWDVVIPNGESEQVIELEGAESAIEVKPERRKVTEDNGMLKVSGTKVRVGAGGCTRAGLTKEQIKQAETDYRNTANKHNVPDYAYLIPDRKPLLMLHVIETLPSSNMNIPPILFAIGIGLPSLGEAIKTANYVVNLVELQSYMEIDEDEDDADAVL